MFVFIFISIRFASLSKSRAGRKKVNIIIVEIHALQRGRHITDNEMEECDSGRLYFRFRVPRCSTSNFAPSFDALILTISFSRMSLQIYPWLKFFSKSMEIKQTNDLNCSHCSTTILKVLMWSTHDDVVRHRLYFLCRSNFRGALWCLTIVFAIAESTQIILQLPHYLVCES